MLGMYMALLDTEEQRNKFEYIYQKYCGFMYHVAMDTLGDHYLAEDASILHLIGGLHQFWDGLHFIDCKSDSTKSDPGLPLICG